jgi:hypothetical protein
MHTGKDKQKELRKHGVIIPIGTSPFLSPVSLSLINETEELESIKLVQRAMPALVDYVKERLALFPVEDDEPQLAENDY